MLTLRHRREAFTLVEMLVVIAIILVITAIGVMAIPSADDRKMQSGVDRFQGWLLIAKQRAKRDGLPTGLRLSFNASGQASTCMYVQQPDDYGPPGTTATCLGTTTVTLAPGTATVDFTTSGVQSGDYLEFNRGGGVYQITAVAAAINSMTLTLAAAGPNLKGTSNAAGTTTEYRIRRQPVPLSGEEVMELPDVIVVDQGKCLNVPARTVAGVTFNEVMFAPQGGMVGRGSGTDQICVLWFVNTRETAANPLLLAIQGHTGFIAVQNMNTDTSKGDAYANCRDLRSSGL